MTGMPSPKVKGASATTPAKAEKKASAQSVSPQQKSERKLEKKIEKQKTKNENLRATIAADEGWELKIYAFEHGPLGMKFEGEVENGSATVYVSEVLEDAQAHKLGVPAGAIIKAIAAKDVSKVRTMAEVVKTIVASLRPVEITMAIPPPPNIEEYVKEHLVDEAHPSPTGELLLGEPEWVLTRTGWEIPEERLKAEKAERERLEAEAAEAKRVAEEEA